MRAILFDFNGVLVDDEPIHLELIGRVLAEEGIEVTEERYTELCLGRNDRSALAALLDDAGEDDDPARVARLVARKATYYHQRVRRDGFPVFDGAVELVRGAADAGRMLGVVSGALRDEVEGALEQMGIRDLFKSLVTAEDVDRGKPDPEGYVRGLRELSALPPLPSRMLHPHEVLAIEDTPAGLDAARAAGLATLGVAQTFDAAGLEADHVVQTIADLDFDRLERLFAD